MIRFNHELINTPKTETLFVAVSMGEDSAILSNFLIKSYRKLCLLHVNHQTGEYSSMAEDRFRKFVRDIQTDVKFVHKDHPGVEGRVLKNTESGEGLSEAELRDIRYDLIKCAVPEGSEVIVCHHLADCVESYLMNCFNGTPEYVPIPLRTDRGSYTVVRPFILTSKEAIQEYRNSSTQGRLNYIIDDPSNDDVDIRRNWIRHVVVPMIKTEYDGIDTVVKKKVQQKIDELKREITEF